MSLSRSIAGALALATILITPAVATASATDLSVDNPNIEGDTTVGSTATYPTRVANNGPETADATLDITLEQADQLVSVTPASGTCTQAAPITCQFTAIAPGASVDVAIKVTYTKTGPGGVQLYVHNDANSDPFPDNNLGGATFTVREPEPEFVETPTARTGSWERTQATLKVDAELSPFGAGRWYFEYGKTASYGKKTDVEKISTQKRDVTRRALLDGLDMKTKYHYRVVLVVDGKTYRSKDKTATTFGKLLYPTITIKATKRTASTTTYEGSIGDGYADAPGACKGTITMNVYTEGGDIMSPETTVNAKTCEYNVTIPFGTTDARKYGPKGDGVFVQARFSGSKAVAAAGSTSDRP